MKLFIIRRLRRHSHSYPNGRTPLEALDRWIDALLMAASCAGIAAMLLFCFALG